MLGCGLLTCCCSLLCPRVCFVLLPVCMCVFGGCVCCSDGPCTMSSVAYGGVGTCGSQWPSTTCSITCNSGYVKSASTSSCGSTGSWSSKQTCKPAPCSTGAPTHGSLGTCKTSQPSGTSWSDATRTHNEQRRRWSLALSHPLLFSLVFALCQQLRLRQRLRPDRHRDDLHPRRLEPQANLRPEAMQAHHPPYQRRLSEHVRQRGQWICLLDHMRHGISTFALHAHMLPGSLHHLGAGVQPQALLASDGPDQRRQGHVRERGQWRQLQHRVQRGTAILFRHGARVQVQLGGAHRESVLPAHARQLHHSAAYQWRS